MRAVDLHCDTLSALLRRERRGESASLRANELHVDIGKLRRGGHLLQCFAVFVDLAEGAPLEDALAQIDLFYRCMEECKDDIAPVTTWAELEEARRAGRLSAMLTAEEGGMCFGEPALLRMLHRLGVRMMTLTWNHENELGWPNRVREGRPEPRGLKERGFAMLAEMERLGVIVDVSHLSDGGFWDVCRAAKKPFVASHSNARAVCGHVRDLTDDMLRALADRGGVAGLNFYPPFLGGASVAHMAAQIEHMRRVGGIGCVALGSDFDGIELTPAGMDDCSRLPLLEAELRRRRFTEDEIESVFCGNALRLLRELLPADGAASSPCGADNKICQNLIDEQAF